jgi:MFS family permease
MGISRDIAILIASGAMRNLGFGFYNVIFAIYLSKLGFGTLTIGSIVTLSSLSGVVQTLVGSILMDRYSRKRIMIFWGLLTFMASGSWPGAVIRSSWQQCLRWGSSARGRAGRAREVWAGP